MTSTEKILVGIMAILVALVIFFAYDYTQREEMIGEKEALLNELHELQIRLYESQQDSLFEIISTLQTENDSLNNVKQQIKVVTIRQIDSIQRLPFGGKAIFFTTAITELDSSRTRYLSNDN